MLTIRWWQSNQSQSRILDTPNEYIISKKKTHASYGVLPSVGLRHSLLSATNEIQKNISKPGSCLNDNFYSVFQQSQENLTKSQIHTETLYLDMVKTSVTRFTCLPCSNNSNDDHNVETDEQPQEEVLNSELLPV